MTPVIGRGFGSPGEPRGMLTRSAFIFICCMAALAGCTGEYGERDYRPACRQELRAANQELSTAKAQGLSDSVAWTKAASLLGAAKVQEQFEEFQNCLIKAREARRYLATIVG